MVGGNVDNNGILVACPSCRRTNRLAFRSLAKEVRCGNCRTPLDPPASTISVTTDELFETLVSQSKLPVLVDFWAEWCGPCKMVVPELEKVAAESAGRVLVAKVNTEVLQRTAAKFQIASIPTLVLMYDGLEVGRLSGARPAADILKFLEKNT